MEASDKPRTSASQVRLQEEFKAMQAKPKEGSGNKGASSVNTSWSNGRNDGKNVNGDSVLSNNSSRWNNKTEPAVPVKLEQQPAATADALKVTSSIQESRQSISGAFVPRNPMSAKFTFSRATVTPEIDNGVSNRVAREVLPVSKPSAVDSLPSSTAENDSSSAAAVKNTELEGAIPSEAFTRALVARKRNNSVAQRPRFNSVSASSDSEPVVGANVQRPRFNSVSASSDSGKPVVATTVFPSLSSSTQSSFSSIKSAGALSHPSVVPAVVPVPVAISAVPSSNLSSSASSGSVVQAVSSIRESSRESRAGSLFDDDDVDTLFGASGNGPRSRRVSTSQPPLAPPTVAVASSSSLFDDWDM